MSSLFDISFNALTLRDIEHVPDDVISLKFQDWFKLRLDDSGTKNELNDSLFGALKDASYKALVTDPIHDGMARWHPLSTNIHLNRTERFIVHTAAAWLGLESKSSVDKKVIYIRKKTSFDAPVFISTTDAISNGAKEFIQKKKPSYFSRQRRLRSCDGCDKTEDEVELCRSVYHHGTFCDDCLENGECETDPENASKWESIHY